MRPDCVTSNYLGFLSLAFTIRSRSYTQIACLQESESATGDALLFLVYLFGAEMLDLIRRQY
jgi:hypothetical protein